MNLVNMKRVFLVTVALYSSCLSLHAQQKQYFLVPQHSDIELSKGKVIAQLKHAQRLKHALCAVAIGSACYGIYNLTTSGRQNNALTIQAMLTSPAGDSTECNSSELTRRLITSLERAEIGQMVLKQELANFGVYLDGNSSMSWKTWLKSWVDFVKRHYIMIGITNVVAYSLNPFVKYFKVFDSAVDKGIAYIFHANDLNWFLSTHTNFTSLFSMLKKDIEAESNTQIALDTMRATWALCCQQIIAVLGFMDYKIEVESRTSVERADRLCIIRTALFDHVERLISDAEKAAHSENTTKAQEIANIVVAIEKQVQDACEQFSLIEAILV